MSILALDEAAALDEKTRDEVMPLVVAIDNAESAHQRSAVLIRDVVENKLGAASSSRAALIAEGARFDQSLATLRDISGRSGHVHLREGAGEIEAKRAELKGALDKIVKFVDEDQEDNAKLAVVADLRPVQTQLSKLLDALRVVVLRESGDALTAAAVQGSRTRHVIAYATIAAALLGLLAAFWMSRQITARIDAAVAATEQVAAGDLAHELESTHSDELGRLLVGLERMRGELVRAVASIREAAGEVESGARGLARRNGDLSSRTEEQASSLEETAASMEQLTATVRQNASGARQADGVGRRAVAVAQRGGEAMSEAAQTMADISKDSRTIGDIVGLIDGIAFQTNILALNAAVEAAHAGDRGRGFAVVASEVRSLASRCGDAARDIRALVDASRTRVERGVTLVEQAGRTMGEIVQAVREVTEQLSSIATASAEQLEGIRQVGDAITKMEQATQQNAAMVEESAIAADRMAGQAEVLVASVARFKTGTDPVSRQAENRVRPGFGAVPPGLQELGGLVREARALPAHERDVSRVRPALEAIPYAGQAWDPSVR